VDVKGKMGGILPIGLKEYWVFGGGKNGVGARVSVRRRYAKCHQRGKGLKRSQEKLPIICTGGEINQLHKPPTPRRGLEELR